MIHEHWVHTTGGFDILGNKLFLVLNLLRLRMTGYALEVVVLTELITIERLWGFEVLCRLTRVVWLH